MMTLLHGYEWQPIKRPQPRDFLTSIRRATGKTTHEQSLPASKARACSDTDAHESTGAQDSAAGEYYSVSVGQNHS